MRIQKRELILFLTVDLFMCNFLHKVLSISDQRRLYSMYIKIYNRINKVLHDMDIMCTPKSFLRVCSAKAQMDADELKRGAVLLSSSSKWRANAGVPRSGSQLPAQALWGFLATSLFVALPILNKAESLAKAAANSLPGKAPADSRRGDFGEARAKIVEAEKAYGHLVRPTSTPLLFERGGI
jgi:hypothetical protein